MALFPEDTLDMLKMVQFASLHSPLFVLLRQYKILLDRYYNKDDIYINELCLFSHLPRIIFRYLEVDSIQQSQSCEVYRSSRDAPYLQKCDHSFSRHEQRKRQLDLLIELVRLRNVWHHIRALRAVLPSSTTTNANHLQSWLFRQDVDNNCETYHETKISRHKCSDLCRNILMGILFVRISFINLYLFLSY